MANVNVFPKLITGHNVFEAVETHKTVDTMKMMEISEGGAKMAFESDLGDIKVVFNKKLRDWAAPPAESDGSFWINSIILLIKPPPAVVPATSVNVGGGDGAQSSSSSKKMREGLCDYSKASSDRDKKSFRAFLILRNLESQLQDIIVPQEMRRCFALIEGQSGRDTKRVILEFSPGSWEKAGEKDSNRITIKTLCWFTQLNSDHLGGLLKYWVANQSVETKKLKFIWIRVGNLPSSDYLSMRNDPTDFEFRYTNGVNLKCHKAILQAADSHYASLIAADPLWPLIDNIDEDPAAMKLFLEIVYSNYEHDHGLHVSSKVTFEVLKIAMKGCNSQLEEKCISALVAEKDWAWFGEDMNALWNAYNDSRSAKNRDKMRKLRLKLCWVIARLIPHDDFLEFHEHEEP